MEGSSTGPPPRRFDPPDGPGDPPPKNHVTNLTHEPKKAAVHASHGALTWRSTRGGPRYTNRGGQVARGADQDRACGLMRDVGCGMRGGTNMIKHVPPNSLKLSP